MGGENTTESKANSSTSLEKNSNAVRRKSGNGMNKLLIIIILILLGAVGFFAYQFLQDDDGDDREVYDGRATFVTDDNVDEVVDSLDDEVEDAYYTVAMSTDWTFYDSKSESTDAYVENMEVNERTVYFDINLSSTGELIYSSPYLPVGTKMQGITLDAELPAGDYPAVITYHLVDDDNQEITTVSLTMNIHVLN